MTKTKLSEPLKALLHAPHARPNPLPPPPNLEAIYERFAASAHDKRIELRAWLTASTAATVTLNSPASLLTLHAVANRPRNRCTGTAVANPRDHSLWTAELMREVGLKCIALNGIPRTINCLGAFYSGLAPSLQTALSTRPPRRHLRPETVPTVLARGESLWDSIYQPLTAKLTSKLATSHPDLPLHIIQSEYGSLFADPPSNPEGPTDESAALRPNIGRVLTSIFAIAALRAQGGVAPQVVSHVFGLRKAFETTATTTAKRLQGEEWVEGGEWLASDEGSVWLIEHVDRIVAGISGSDSSLKARL